MKRTEVRRMLMVAVLLAACGQVSGDAASDGEAEIVPETEIDDVARAMMDAVGGTVAAGSTGASDNSVAPLPEASPLDSAWVAQAASATIPLCPGLTIVTAVSQSSGDYESIKTIESVTPAAVRLKYSSERSVSDLFNPNEPDRLIRNTVHRTMLTEDLRSAPLYLQQFHQELPETVPGTTAVGVSAATFESMRSGRETRLGIFHAIPGKLGIDRSVRPHVYDYHMVAPVKRLETTPVMMPVIVNDVLMELPSIRVEGRFYRDSVEFFFLDDPANPITLKFRIGIDAYGPAGPEVRALCEHARDLPPSMLAGSSCAHLEGGDKDVLQVIRISHRCPARPAAPAGGGGGPVQVGDGVGDGGQAPGGALEQALAEHGRAEIYDIHFSFNSDEIREESEARLHEIAEVLRRHPDWRLSVEGHTDSIGTDEANLDLSRRRAAAVMDALVGRYGIDAGRLVTAGYGESRPRDTNDTLEGRAHNRRVELVRR